MGLTVSDLERSIAFYRDVVGFEEATSRRRLQGEWFDTLTHNDGADIDTAYLRLGGFTLQLVQYLAAGGPAPELSHHWPGNPHLSIDVDDVDARHAMITASGMHRPTAI